MKKNKPHGFMLSPAIAVCALTLQQVVDNLLPVLAVGTIADMHPIAPFGVVFHDELVKDDMRLDPIKPPLALQLVAVDAEVGCFAVQVLRVADTADGCVESWATVAAAYLYLLPHRVA